MNIALYITKKSCTCAGMIKAAEMILNNGICSLCDVFRYAFPNTTYKSYHAKSRLLQMPTIAIRVGSPASGCAEVKIMESHPGVDPRMI